MHALADTLFRRRAGESLRDQEPFTVWKKRRRKKREERRGLPVALEESLYDLAAIRVVLGKALDFLDGVHDGRMVFVVEKPSDLRVRQGGQLAAEIHGHLPRK